MLTSGSDAISTHEKKRVFLEGLEEYVEWLEDQLRAAGIEPVQMNRVPIYRVPEIRTKSIRVSDPSTMVDCC